MSQSRVIYDPASGKYFEVSITPQGQQMGFREVPAPRPEVGKQVIQSGADAIKGEVVKEGVKKAGSAASKAFGLDSISPAAQTASTAGEAFPVGTAMNGGTMMSDGSIMAPGALSQLGTGLSQGFAGLGTSGTALSYAGPAALGAAGAYGMYDLFSKNAERGGTGKGMLQGAASGAALGTAIMPGIGTAVGAGLGGLAGAFSTKSRTRVEQHLRDKLIEQGINVPIHETARDGKAWELNEEFARTRNESALKGGDIKDAAWFYANVPGYDKFTDDQRTQLAQYQLDKGTVKEHHGTIEGKADQGFMDMAAGFMPQESSGGGSSRQTKAKRRAAATMDLMAPEMSQGARYDLGQSVAASMRNPYL